MYKFIHKTISHHLYNNKMSLPIFETHINNFTNKHTLIIGECGSGKTHYILSILELLKLLNVNMKLFVPKLTSDYEEYKDYIEELNIDNLRKLVNQMYINPEFYPELKDVKLPSCIDQYTFVKQYLVFDDCESFFNEYKDDPVITEIYLNSRHLGINLIFTAQSDKFAIPAFRRMFNNVIFTTPLIATKFVNTLSNGCDAAVKKTLRDFLDSKSWYGYTKLVYNRDMQNISIIKDNTPRYPIQSPDLIYEMQVTVELPKTTDL